MAHRFEDNLRCPTCLVIFPDPVVLPCSHSFCRTCTQKWWEQTGDQTCPLCRKEFTLMDPPGNPALRNVCEMFSKFSVKSGDICSLHKEKLNLFCLDHRELVCLVCRDAKLHSGHRFSPLNEVTEDHKEKLKQGLQGAKKRLKDYNETRDNCDEQVMHIKVQREQLESQIKKYYEELHGFLKVEEESKLSALRTEEEEKTRMLKEKMLALSRDIDALSDSIRSTEELLASDPVPFMKNFQTAMTRVQMPANNFIGWERIKGSASSNPTISNPNMSRHRFRQGTGLSDMMEEQQKRSWRMKDAASYSDSVLPPSHEPISVRENLQTSVNRVPKRLDKSKHLYETVLDQGKPAEDQTKKTVPDSPVVLDSNTINKKSKHLNKLTRVFRTDSRVHKDLRGRKTTYELWPRSNADL